MLHFTGLLEHENWRYKEKHLPSHVSIGWTEQQFPEVFSAVFGSTVPYSHVLWQQVKKRDGLQLQVLSTSIQLSGE